MSLDIKIKFFITGRLSALWEVGTGFFQDNLILTGDKKNSLFPYLRRVTHLNLAAYNCKSGQ